MTSKLGILFLGLYSLQIVSALEDCSICFSAIKTLHSNLDDDNDGEIDNDESENFIKEELSLSNGIGSDRHKRFHLNGKDNSITVEELWQSWKKSQVHNWTIQDTLDWLIYQVELPQYAKNFADNSIDGSQLPRLAVAESQFFTQLGIMNAKDKHKLILKSTDVVLFGPPKRPGFAKDVVIACVVCVILCAGGFCYVTYSRYNQSQSQLKSLQYNFEQMSELQIELDKALKVQVDAASNKKNTEKWTAPPALEDYLKITYQLESQYYNQRKMDLESRTLEVKQRNLKLQKKKTTFLGYYKMAQENSLEDDYNDIVVIKEEIRRITNEIKERTTRWRAIEDICGFSIM